MASKPKHVKLREARNHPPDGEPWIWHTREMLESDAWRTMLLDTRRVIDRLELEHMAHAGRMNGLLICTYNDFEKWGIRRKSIKHAIDGAVTRGLIVVTAQGKASTGLDRRPSHYALGWLPMHDGAAAMNRWKLWKPAKHSFSPRGRIATGKPRKRVIPQGQNRHWTRGAESPLATAESCGSVQGQICHYSIDVAGSPLPLPPGWQIGKGSSGQIRILKPDGDRWIEIPVVDDPLIGSEAERAALLELQRWTQQRG